MDQKQLEPGNETRTSLTLWRVRDARLLFCFFDATIRN